MKLFLLALALAIPCSFAQAQADFPNRPITIVVPVPAGGATDKTIRLVAKHLQDKWKQAIVIDNRAGASGNIASAFVAKAAPDGYTLLVSAGPFSINPSLFRQLPFDTQKDFQPIIQMASFSSVLLVHSSFPVKTISDFITLTKSAKEPVAYASAGSGTAQHLGMELLRSQMKLNLNHIPYKGGAPAINDLLAGHIKVMLAGMGDASPHLTAGRVLPLAVTGKSRSPLLPKLPTFTEIGMMDFDASGWNGLHAPAGTSAVIIQKINHDVFAVLNDPAVRQAMAAMDIEPRPSTVGEFRSFMEGQFSKWREAVELSGAKAD